MGERIEASVRLWLRRAACVAIAGASVACGATTGSADAGRDGDASFSDGGAIDGSSKQDGTAGRPACVLTNGGLASATCDPCMAAHCCIEFNACFDDLDCLALAGCASDCVADAGADAGTACVQACEAQHQGAVAHFHSWLFCIDASCRQECGQ